MSHCWPYEIRGEPIGITGIVVVRVAVRVHIAEVVSVVVIRRTLPPIRSSTRKETPTDRFSRNTPIKSLNLLPPFVAFKHIGQHGVFGVNEFA
mgnify:CR=1 FL=1